LAVGYLGKDDLLQRVVLMEASMVRLACTTCAVYVILSICYEARASIRYAMASLATHAYLAELSGFERSLV